MKILGLLLLLAASVFGQATSQIQGTVSDPAGLGLAEAEVRATQTDTGSEWVVRSGAGGNYVFSNLAIGPYRITVTRPDFKTAVRADIVLQVATIRAVDFVMQLGSVSDTITVTEDAALVETRTTSIGVVMDRERIVALPLNSRNPVELIQLAGGAVPAGKNSTAGFPGGLNFIVAGGQLNGIGYLLDGTMYNNLFDAVNLPFPFPDALQEFIVETSTMTAKNGTHASASVSGSVKSGTNQFHGGVFEFFRNGNMNARNAFARRRDTLKRNQFGGTIGGPIAKNKLFFFAGYQGTLIRSDPGDRPAFVPTKQMLAGDFSCFNSPDFLTDPEGPAGTTFPGKQIPVSRFSDQARRVAEFLPDATGPCGQVLFGPITNSNEHQALGRVDYTLNSKHQLFGRYIGTTFGQPAPYALSGNVLDTVAGGIDDFAQSAAVGHTYAASPNVVNQLRFAGNRVAVRRFSADYFSGCSVGVSMYCYKEFEKQTILSVLGAFTVGSSPASPAIFFPTYFSLSDDVSVVRGSHTFAFGYSGFKYQHSQTVNITAVGNFAFNPNATGLSMADFLLGRLASLTQSAPTGVYANKWGHSLYAQDTWRVSRRLTLNYGLRWEPFLPQSLNDGAVYNFSMDAFKAGVRSQTVVNAPPGLSYPGDPGFQGKSGVNKRWNQFAPRVGIAWDPRGNGMTSIRLSGGIAYDFPNLQIMSNSAAAPPFSGRVFTAGGLFGTPYGAGNTGPFPAAIGPNSAFPGFGSFIAQQPNAKGPTTYTWNFSLQHQLGRDWFVSASYLGSQSIHVWVSQALNPAILIPGPVGMCPPRQTTNCNAISNTNNRRLASLWNSDTGGKLGSVDMLESGGGSNYNGLILSTQKRLSRGVSFNANYTWSHCIGDMPIGAGPGSIAAGGGSYIDPNDRRRDRGNCSTTTIDGLQSLDRRHIFNFTTVLETPAFSDRILNRIASHWKLSSSYRFLSASYLTVTTGADLALTGASLVDQRANQLLEDVHCKPRKASCWINPLAFERPAQGTLGNAGRANVAGPGFFGVDVAVSRIFRVREWSLEARGEAFNLTNSVRLNAPVTAIVTDFGKVQTAQDPRILQVALKLAF